MKENLLKLYARTQIAFKIKTPKRYRRFYLILHNSFNESVIAVVTHVKHVDGVRSLVQEHVKGVTDELELFYCVVYPTRSSASTSSTGTRSFILNFLDLLSSFLW